MLNKIQNPAALVGRILLALIFVTAGFGKITGYAGAAGYMASKGLPLIDVLLPLTILVELGGGLLIVFGLFSRYAALAIFLFLIPVTLIFHSAGDAVNQIMFMKNISIMGGLLLLIANGPGMWSIDGRLRGSV